MVPVVPPDFVAHLVAREVWSLQVCGDEQVDAERPIREPADRTDLIAHVVRSHDRRAEATETARIGHGGYELGGRHRRARSCHPGLEDWHVDAEKVTQWSSEHLLSSGRDQATSL